MAVFRCMAIYIGLEGHDGTGKSSTADNLLTVFEGRTLHRTDEMAVRRKALISKKDKREMTLSELSIAQDITYRDECAYIKGECSNMAQHELVVLDRTWASHAAEQVVDCWNEKESFEHQQKDGTIQFPKGVLEPSVTFELYIEEEIRSYRVTSRGETLESRDWKLQNDPEYRKNLEMARKDLGCIRLSLRERDQRTSGLRAAQVLLGHSSIPPLNLKPNWRK